MLRIITIEVVHAYMAMHPC